MRIARNLRDDQDNIKRFLTSLGSASVEVGHSKRAKPGFFVFAHGFIHEYIEGGLFRKEELLVHALQDAGFPPNEGPIYLLHTDQRKSREAAELLLKASKEWQSGDEGKRIEVGWAASEYTTVLRQHLDRLKNLIFPLLEQSISEEDEQRIAEGITKVVFEGSMEEDAGKYARIIQSLEEELGDWK